MLFLLFFMLFPHMLICMEEDGTCKGNFLTGLPNEIFFLTIKPNNHSYQEIKEYCQTIQLLKQTCKALNTKLCQKSFQEYMRTLKSLIAENNRFDKQGDLPLVKAVSEKNEQEVWRLLMYGANPNKGEKMWTLSTKKNNHPLFVAAYAEGDKNISDMLLKFGAQPDLTMVNRSHYTNIFLGMRPDVLDVKLVEKLRHKDRARLICDGYMETLFIFFPLFLMGLIFWKEAMKEPMLS
jgi:hypothetical protein